MKRLTSESDSRLPILFKCIGPGVLQKSKHTSSPADIGHAIHEHLDLRVKVGVEQAFAMLDETVDKYDLSEVEVEITKARCRSFEFNPPKGAGAELALAWSMEGSKLKPVKVKGEKGIYKVDGNIIGSPGTIDLIFSDPEPLIWDGGYATCPAGSNLWVCDYKTGSETWVDPVGRNKQLASAAVKAAIWTGATRVIPAIIYVQKGEGHWEIVDEPWGMDKIKATIRSILDLHNQIAIARDEYKQGKIPMLVEGYHCRYCDSVSYCPAISASSKNLMQLPKEALKQSLTDAEAQKLAQMYPIITDLATRAKKALEAYVIEHGPIDVGSGRMYGPVDSKRDMIDPGIGLEVLTDMLGKEFAISSVKMTKAGVKKAISEHHENKGLQRKGAAWERDFYNTAKARGGVHKEDYENWTTYKKEDVPAALPMGKDSAIDTDGEDVDE